LTTRTYAALSLTTSMTRHRQGCWLGSSQLTKGRLHSCRHERKKIEFSARLHHLWNSTNNDPFVELGIRSMQPGHAFHVNYATTFELWKNVRLGLNGYWLQQLTDHHINGSDVRNARERTIGLGPGIQLGGGTISFRLNGYIETDVHNRPSGIKVTFRISKAIPTKESRR